MNTKLITKSEIQAYLNTELALTFQEINDNDILSIEALQSKGIAIIDMTILSQTDVNKTSILILSVLRNISKFKAGDKVLLTDNRIKLNAIIISASIFSIKLRISKKKKLDVNRKWSILSTQLILTDSILRSLSTLENGLPGWTFFQFVTSDAEFNVPSFLKNKPITSEEYANELIDIHIGDDSAKRDAIKKCLQLPSIFAIQGPPGTGKTLVLALVAEILAASFKRVAVLAFTHQAVNNALNQIYKINPSRELIKIGDDLQAETLSHDVDIRKFNEFHKNYSGYKKRLNEPIIGLTYHAALSHLGNKANSFAPNIILIDEAGQLNLSLGLLSGKFGASSILLFGDDAQMPPIFKSELKTHPLSVSLFQQIRKKDESLVDRLDTTYRLNQDLTNIIGARFYSKTNSGTTFLKASNSCSERRFNFIDSFTLDEPYNEILDSESFVWLEIDDKYSTQLNYRESKIVSDLVSILLKGGISKGNIAVVTPFRRNSAEIIRNLLNNNFSYEELPIIDTVEKVQGATVEIVIISYCSSDPGYIVKQSEFLFSKNRLNVSISRAKTKVIMMMNESFLNCIPSLHESVLTQNILKGLHKQVKVIKI